MLANSKEWRLDRTQLKGNEMKTETVLKTVMGQCQYFRSEADMLDYYNKNGKHYIIKDGKLIHKGHNMLVGRVEMIIGRDEVPV